MVGDSTPTLVERGEELSTCCESNVAGGGWISWTSSSSWVWSTTPTNTSRRMAKKTRRSCGVEALMTINSGVGVLMTYVDTK